MAVTVTLARLPGLLDALPPRTPAAVVQHAGTPQERQCVTTLGHLAADARSEGLGSPAIVLVGDVLRARAALQGPARRAA